VEVVVREVLPASLEPLLTLVLGVHLGVDPHAARELPQALDAKPVHRHFRTQVCHHVRSHPPAARHVQTRGVAVQVEIESKGLKPGRVRSSLLTLS
jgi:hypothetical protein